MGMRPVAVGAIVAAALTTVAAPASAAEITLWSHWADHATKVAFVEEAARRFEAANPGDTVKISWYQKNPLYAAVKASLQAGQGPDIFYCEPSQTEYVDNGFLHPLDDHIDWDNVKDWARGTFLHDGKTYGFPLEASTVELYYNTDKMAELGVDLPEDGKVDAATFLDIVKTASASGTTPIVQGVGDRPYPGAYLLAETLLKKLGKDDYGKLLSGNLSFKDPRVVEVFEYVAGLVDAGAYPKSFSTLKLGESHYYFHTTPGGLMFPMGSWYTSRAFNPAEQGGQPDGFPLSIMQFPVPDGAACPECKTTNVAGSFCVNADSPHADKAAGVLNEMAATDMGTQWLTTVLVETGVKSDPSKIAGIYKPYFDRLQAIDNANDFFIGQPLDHMKGQCAETFKQVMNAAFPAGQIDADRATSMMDAACFTGS